MFKPLFPILTAFSVCLGSLSVFAQAICSPEKLNAAIDIYANDPFGARSWRVLQGLGDPGLEASSTYSGNWEKTDTWKKRVTALAPGLQSVQEPNYECRMDYPLQVLESHVKQLGATSPYIKQWLMVQGAVMAACGGKQDANLSMPAPLAELSPDVLAMQANDRSYQEASIAFYNDKAKALGLFRQIGASTSPHRAYARYNVANLLANTKDVNGARSEAKAILADVSLAPVHGITQELLGYISNIEDTPAGWSSLIDDTISVLSKPKAEILTSDKLKSDYARALNDISYGGIAAKRDDWWITGKLPENPTLSKAVMDAARQSPMALWMMTGQSVNANYNTASWAMVGDKWNGWTASYIDRAMALQPAPISGLARDLIDGLKAKPDEATRVAAWTKAKAASEVSQSSCGEAPDTAAAGQLTLNAVRLSALAGKFDEIYAGLASVPFKGSEAYTHNIVGKLAQYILATGNVEEGRRLRDHLLTSDFFTTVPKDRQDSLKLDFGRYLGWVAEDQKAWVQALSFTKPELGSTLLNLLPARKLEALAGADQFSLDQKALLLRTAWTRNFAMGRGNSVPQTNAMLAANSVFKSDYDNVGKAFPKLDDKRRWLLTILRNPRFNILVNSPGSINYDAGDGTNAADMNIDGYDHNDKNWWCPLEPGRQLHALRQDYDSASGADVQVSDRHRELFAAFDLALAEKMNAGRERLLKQHPMIRSIDVGEVRRLSHMPSAPKALTQAAIAWGQASKGDDGAPEALARAVEVTHYGCNWHGGHKAYSKPAQELLKAKFGNSEWKTKTPYWFDCMDSVWDKNSNKVANCKPHVWPKDTLPH